MKKIILLVIAVNAAVIMMLVGLLYLSEVYPFQPGNPLFAIQSFAERQRINLTSDPLQKAEMSFTLVERRLSDLASVPKEKRMKPALKAFERALSDAMLSMDKISPAQGEILNQHVSNTLVRVEIVLAGLEEKIATEKLQELQLQVDTLQAAFTPQSIPVTGSNPAHIPAIIVAKVIPFLGKDVDHVDFPLNGGHAFLECEDCHANGVYENTSTVCSTCHELEKEYANLDPKPYPTYPLAQSAYPLHFAGECEDCHGISSWTPTQFDHEGITECISCHEEDVPREEIEQPNGYFTMIGLKEDFKQLGQPIAHYPGDCMQCHTDTSSWKKASYNHNLDTCDSCHNAADTQPEVKVGESCMELEGCADCHQYDDHRESYEGDCVNCHIDYDDWKIIKVDHSQYPNCYACHLDERPEKHSQSICSKCHYTTTWDDVFFVHDPNSSCETCHAAPAKHFDGNCNSCHSMDTWKGASYHLSSNCTDCHSTPSNHYPSDCVSCHNYKAWNGIQYQHNEPIPCTACHTLPDTHYAGECSNCHSATAWTDVAFDHTGLDVCIQCHAAPQEHYAGDCQNCHITATWDLITFNHTGYTSCENCHTTPAEHYPGACIACHNATSWNVVTYNHDNADTCTTCHAQPSGHWPGQCSRCHDTSAWTEIDFDHTNYTDCKSCHTRPANHSRGQCSRCHTTDSWLVETPTPTLLTPTQIIDITLATLEYPFILERPETKNTPKILIQPPIIDIPEPEHNFDLPRVIPEPEDSILPEGTPPPNEIIIPGEPGMLE